MSKGQTGTEVLLEAMSKDKVHLARFILDALDGTIVDSKMEGAQTPLITAVILPERHDQARSEFMDLLLKRGASVNCQGEDGRTALSHACEQGYLEAVKTLIRNNADPEIVDTWGNTALMYATVAGHSPVVEFLVRAFKRLGLQIHRQNKVGNSAVELAKVLGHAECFLALTSNSKKGREREGGAGGMGWPQVTADCSVKFDNLECLEKRLEALQISPPCDKPSAQEGAGQPTPGRRRKSLMDSLRSRLQSMGSIEEFERENDSPSSPQELVFSGGLTPKPPPRTVNRSPVCCKPPPTAAEERLSSTDGQLPPLSLGCNPTASAPNPLRILLTPILNNTSGNELDKDMSQKIAGFKVRQFNESYYQKRCSLPTTSILSPTPPDRALMASRNSKTTTRRRAATSPARAGTRAPKGAPSSTSPTAFSVLSNKLLRRFTFPECKPPGKEPGACSMHSGDDAAPASVRIPRSETFPQDKRHPQHPQDNKRHPQVGSKPSIDSISAVKCEFDFHFRAPPSS